MTDRLSSDRGEAVCGSNNNGSVGFMGIVGRGKRSVSLQREDWGYRCSTKLHFEFCFVLNQRKPLPNQGIIVQRPLDHVVAARSGQSLGGVYVSGSGI